MSFIDNVQTKLDNIQANLNAKVDEAQAKLSAKVDEAQAKVNDVKAKIDEKEDKVEGAIAKVKAKIHHGFELVEAAFNLVGITPANIRDIAKVVIGKNVATKPIVLPVVKSLVTVKVVQKPADKVLKDAIEAIAAADEAKGS